MSDTTAIILAGGFSSRMNRNNKAFLQMKGKSLIEIILEQVSVFPEIIIITNSPEEYAHLGVKTVTDIIPQRGPMSGIHSGLTHAGHERCITVPCDTPFIKQEVLLYMAAQAEGYDVAVPRLKEKYQPLCGCVYSKACIAPMEDCLKNDIRKLTRIYPLVRVREVTEEELKEFGEPEEFFRNINDPEEYAKFCL